MELPSGTMLFWDTGTIPTGWGKIDSSLNNHPIRGLQGDTNNPGTITNGSPVLVPAKSHTHSYSGNSPSTGISHDHDNKALTLTTSSPTGPGQNGDYGLTYKTAGDKNHTHSLTLGTDSKIVTHYHSLALTITGITYTPPYKRIIVIKKL